MTVIALLDTELEDSDKGVIDCMVGLPETARAPSLKDFDVRASGTGAAEVIGVTPLAGARRNAYRLTIRFLPDAGLLCVRYRPERTSTHGTRQGAGIDVTIMGSECRSVLDANGDEWHLPLQAAHPFQAAYPTQTDSPVQTGARSAAETVPAEDTSPAAPPTEARVLPLLRPTGKPAHPGDSRVLPAADAGEGAPDVAPAPVTMPRK